MELPTAASLVPLPTSHLRRVIYCPNTPHSTGDQLLDPSDLAQRIADLLSDRQAEDIVLMDIGKVSTFTEYFVVATANSPRQLNALIDALDRDLREDGIRPRKVEGAADSGWVLIDFGDAIVHLFSSEMRTYYNLETLWAKGVSVVHMQ